MGPIPFLTPLLIIFSTTKFVVTETYTKKDVLANRLLQTKLVEDFSVAAYGFFGDTFREYEVGAFVGNAVTHLVSFPSIV